MTHLCECGCGELAWSPDHPYALGHEAVAKARRLALHRAISRERLAAGPKIGGKAAKRQRVKDRKAISQQPVAEPQP